MKKNPPRSPFSESEGRRIFLYKRDSRHSRLIESASLASSPTTKAEPDELLKEIFPDLRIGKAFISHALSQLDACATFGAMVILIDPLKHPDEGLNHEEIIEIPPEIEMDTAHTIDIVCKAQKGVWGHLEPAVFGCFLPDIPDSRCMDLAHEIQRKLSRRRSETVSIGIAGYPCINFPKTHIIDNAYKALEHAGFFGPVSTVIFNAVSLNISADRLYQKRDLPGAIEEFTFALMLDPSNVNVHNSLGVCYGELGDFEKALEAFETALWLAPQEVMALFNKGLIHMLKEKREKALEYFLEAERKGNDIFEIVFQIGKLYLELDQTGKARNYLEKAARIKPTSGLAYAALGDCYVSMEHFDDAISAFQKAIKKNPNDAASLSALGSLLESKDENLEIATTFCLHSVKIQPESGLFWYRLGNLYLKQNRLEDALGAFMDAKSRGYNAEPLIAEIQQKISIKAD